MWVGNGKGGGKKVEIIIHLAKLGGEGWQWSSLGHKEING